MYNVSKQGGNMGFSAGVKINPMYHNNLLSESLAYIEERSDFLFWQAALHSNAAHFHEY